MISWKRTFACTFVAQILAIVGFSFCMPFLPFFIAELGVPDKATQTWWAGIVMSATGVTLAIFAPVWGYLADRYGRRIMVMRAMFVGSLVLLLISFARSVGQLALLRLFQGAFTGTLAASIALVASVAPPHRSGLTLGLMQTAVFIGDAIGPLAGGFLSDHIGYRPAFRVGALMAFLGGMLILYGTRESFQPAAATAEQNLQRFGDTIRKAGFIAAVAVLFSIRFSNTLTNPSFPLIVSELVGKSGRLNSITGMITCSSAIAGAFSATLLGYFGDSWSHKRVLLVCCFTTAIVALAHFFATSVPYLLVARTLFGLAVAGMIPSVNALIRRNIHARHIGKAYGAATSISMTGFALGPFVGGWVGMHLGLRMPFVLAAIGQLIVALLVAFFIKEDQNSPKGMATGIRSEKEVGQA